MLIPAMTGMWQTPGHTMRSRDSFIRSCSVFALACWDGFADRYIQAGV